MSRIRIEDLPEELTLGKEEMREVLGGVTSAYAPNAVTCAVMSFLHWIFGEDDSQPPEPSNAVAGVRG